MKNPPHIKCLLLNLITFYDQTFFLRISSSHRLEHRGIVSPSIIEYTSAVTVAQDEGAVLMCVAQGCPSVEYR